jgi:integrase
MSWFRKRKRGGQALYYWVAKVPVRTEDGSICWRKIERGTGTSNIAEARKKAEIFEREFHEQLDRKISKNGPELIFAEAASTYMRSGGDRTYLASIIAEIGLMPVSKVDNDVVQALAEKLYPSRAASTVNRKIYTPILAVLHMASRARKCPPPMLTRPKGHDKAPALKIPPEDWFFEILPHLSPSKRALLLLITLHGMRISEAIERTPEDVDTSRWTITVPDTKTGEPALVRLSPPVIAAIKEIPQWKAQRWLFGTCHRSNIARDFAKAAKAAGVPHFGTHAIGRHSFATRILRDGRSLKFLKDAGRWKTIKMPATRYGHLEQSEVADGVSDLAERWSESSSATKVIKLHKA